MLGGWADHLQRRLRGHPGRMGDPEAHPKTRAADLHRRQHQPRERR